MAQFHSQDIPISKEPRWIFDILNELNDELKKLRFDNENYLTRYQKFQSFNLEDEITKLMYDTDPNTMSHNLLFYLVYLILSPKRIVDFHRKNFEIKRFFLFFHFLFCIQFKIYFHINKNP